MYIQKENAKRFSVKHAFNMLAANEQIKSKAAKLAKGSAYETTNKLLENAARELVNLNNALLSKKPDIWAECTKCPSNLDRGRHWYQIYYILKGERRHFWSIVLMDKSNDRSSYGYGFSSGAIGMSRLLDATDYPFTLIKQMGGAYCQLT